MANRALFLNYSILRRYYGYRSTVEPSTRTLGQMSKKRVGHHFEPRKDSKWRQAIR